MDYQTNRLITKKRPPNQQRHPIGNNFPNHSYEYFAIINISYPIARPLYTTKSQSQEQNKAQLVPKPISHSVNFNDNRKTQKDRTESYPFFKQIALRLIRFFNKTQITQFKGNSSEANHSTLRLKVIFIQTNNNE